MVFRSNRPSRPGPPTNRLSSASSRPPAIPGRSRCRTEQARILRRRMDVYINAKIREARVIDSPFITEFNLRMAWETEKRRLDPQRVGQGVAALLNDPAKGTYFIAEIEGG